MCGLRPNAGSSLSSVGLEHLLYKQGVDSSNLSESTKIVYAGVVELVDTQDLKSCDHYSRVGSSPTSSTESN